MHLVKSYLLLYICKRCHTTLRRDKKVHTINFPLEMNKNIKYLLLFIVFEVFFIGL
jgi:hypothetical protein